MTVEYSVEFFIIRELFLERIHVAILDRIDHHSRIGRGLGTLGMAAVPVREESDLDWLSIGCLNDASVKCVSRLKKIERRR